MRNIVLFCAGGMSTSMMVKKMEASAKEQNYECTISAHALSEAQVYGKDADAILVGPQVRYALNDLKKAFPNTYIDAIDMRAYGMMDGATVLKQVKSALND